MTFFGDDNIPETVEEQEHYLEKSLILVNWNGITGYSEFYLKIKSGKKQLVRQFFNWCYYSMKNKCTSFSK